MPSSVEDPLLESEQTTAQDSSQISRDDLDANSPRGSIHSTSDSLSTSSSQMPHLPRTLTNLNGLALVIGLQIGSGIFSAPAVVISKTSSPILGIIIWLLTGLLVWTGAASFIELGTRVPLNGGTQEYLRHCFGDLYGFLFAIVWLLISRPCALAIVSLVFSEYLFRAFSPDQDVSIWIIKVVALLAVISITWINCLGTKVGTGAATFFLVLKLVGLGSVALTGFVLLFTGLPSPTRSSTSPSGPTFQQSSASIRLIRSSSAWESLGDVTDGALAALFAYGGWDSIGFVVGEVAEPSRNLPLILNRSMAIVITLFTLANAAFYSVLPLKTFQETNAVAIAFGSAVLATPGALFYAWIVCLACLGTINAIVFSTGRLTQAAGSRHYLPGFLKCDAGLINDIPNDSHVNTGFLGRLLPAVTGTGKQNIPINAMVLDAAIAAIYIFIGTFRELINLKSMAEYTIFLAAVSGLILVRSRQNEEFSPTIYQTPIFNPIIFCTVAALIVLRSAIAHTFLALAIVFLSVGSTLLYRSKWWIKLTGHSDSSID